MTYFSSLNVNRLGIFSSYNNFLVALQVDMTTVRCLLCCSGHDLGHTFVVLQMDMITSFLCVCLAGGHDYGDITLQVDMITCR